MLLAAELMTACPMVHPASGQGSSHGGQWSLFPGVALLFSVPAHCAAAVTPNEEDPTQAPAILFC